jgi:hypothetical protein
VGVHQQPIMLVRSLYRYGLVTTPWSGVPNQSMVGGPPPHSAIKSGWGPRLAVRGSSRRRTHPTPQTLTDPREHWSGGKLRHRRRRGPLPGSSAPGATARRSTKSFVTPSSPSRHCIPCVKPRPPLRPRPARWLPTPRSRPTPMVCIPRFPSVYLSSCIRCSRSRSRYPCCLSVIFKFTPEQINYWCLCMFKCLRSNNGIR